MDKTERLFNENSNQNNKYLSSKDLEEKQHQNQSQKPQFKRKSLITDKISLSDSDACISLIRKKESQHGFLLIEYVDQDEYYIKRSDLFLDGSQPKFLVKGMALVELKDYTEKK